MPVSDVLRDFDGFAISYDTRLRNPRWVLERITRTSSHGDGKRLTVPVTEDDSIPERLRSRLCDYERSGYDRGHMVSVVSRPTVANTFQNSESGIHCALSTAGTRRKPQELTESHRRHIHPQQHCTSGWQGLQQVCVWPPSVALCWKKLAVAGFCGS